jgi:DNA-directed RNA polymerase specialized sigma24 family protein
MGVEQFPTDDDETGFTFDPPDSTRLSPEQLTIAADILERLDPLHRKAFALYLNGFTYYLVQSGRKHCRVAW